MINILYIGTSVRSSHRNTIALLSDARLLFSFDSLSQSEIVAEAFLTI